ncbi:MAG TPA: hypothetical protein DEO84_08940, partial [candidate division Zixibacteria bacterium]|nr:hypothetical protein [candidate division Zixibacteria bacterium]
MRYISFCLFWASISLAAANYDSPPGSIARPGYDYKSIPYISSSTDAGINAMKDRYGASYVSCNSQVPSQAIIVSPATGIETNLITNSNIESITRAYLSTFLPPSCDLELISKKLVMNRTWFINFQKTLNGIPIEDATLNLAITPHGHISVLWGDISTSPINSVYFALPSDAAREIAGRGLEGTIRENRYLGNVILPLCFGQRTEYHPAHKTMIVTDNPYAEWLVYVDAENSQILQRTNKVYYDQISGSVSGVIQPLYPFDEWESRPFSDFNLNFDGYGVATTDSNGNYSFYIPNTNHANIISFLRGPYLEVIDSVGPESQIIDSIPSPSNYYIHWDDSNSLPQERDAWRNAVLAHNWIARFDSGLHVMDYPMTCNIDIPGACNAFWSSWYQTINFTGAGEDCPNIVQVADVVFHEYGHGITDLQTRPYGPNSAMHEGFSDYFACTITNQPHVGVGFYYNPPGSYLRNLDNSMKFPDNWTGDPHNDGQIISGALWHVRQALSPYPMGYADSLWHFARYAHAQSFDSYFWTLVALDDNDGNLSNGTPHAWTIFHNFGDRHGIGPGTQMTVVADTILDSEDTTATFPVSATITSVFTVRSDSVILFYDNGNGYEAISMVWNDTSWIAQIPSQHDNTHINYYILGVDSAGFRGTFPSGAPANYLSFYIGPDHNPPVLELVYNPSNTINLDGPYGPFIITARDINGINPSMVRMRYHVNSEPERTTSLLPGTNPDEYILASLQLSRYLFTGDTIYYYFTARDNA